ncbi:MAG: response regulator [Alphaproteobacteria bacterium]|nr:response regulator [Alphaproteobacteria bacterium]MBU1515826.1 response regulator [Alphaproteobacteria bacterium]MBU2094048.1 response regulator [Alphaproteobacteria bacterium]MBU2151400.1 response regulator [Alphaproteobacteria bacterium]MBU2305324.1 response regulator [Alphaproteobacteria bacterium]
MAYPNSVDATVSRVDAPPDPTHELKNLLGVLLGVCESLGDGLDSRAEQAELGRVGVLAAEKAGNLVTRLQRELRTRPAPAPELVRQPEGAGRTVLVVDDDPDLLKLIAAAFARAGFKAYSARNGRLAVQLVRALKPDLMVTDIVMPEKEGIATIIEVKAASPDTAVIAISGGGAYGRSGNFLQWAEELGADEVMAKPFPMSELMTAARVVLDRKGAPSAARAAAG